MTKKAVNPETNQEILTRLFDTLGPMAEMFVIDALTKHTQKIIDNETEVIEQMENDFIHGPAWVQVAKDIKRELDAVYNSDKA